MESLFLINPRGKKRRKGRMPAGLRRYWAARRAGKSSHRKRRRKARAVMTNPRRRRRNPARAHRRIRRRARRANPKYHKRRRRANPVFHRRRSRHRARNPFSTRGLTAFIKPAAIGAAGAIGMSIAYGYAAPMLPATLTTGYLPTVVKAAAAIGLGMLVGKFMSKQDGQYATIGGLTVVLVGAITPLITSAAPTLPGLSGLAGYGDYIPYSRPGMGAYIANPGSPGAQYHNRGAGLAGMRGLGGARGLGFYNPAAVLPAKSGMGAYMSRGVPGMGDMQGGSGYTGMNDGM